MSPYVENKNNVRVVLVINNPLGLRRKNLTRARKFHGCNTGWSGNAIEGERLILRNQRYRDALCFPRKSVVGITPMVAEDCPAAMVTAPDNRW